MCCLVPDLVCGLLGNCSLIHTFGALQPAYGEAIITRANQIWDYQLVVLANIALGPLGCTESNSTCR